MVHCVTIIFNVNDVNGEYFNISNGAVSFGSNFFYIKWVYAENAVEELEAKHEIDSVLKVCNKGYFAESVFDEKGNRIYFDGCDFEG